MVAALNGVEITSRHTSALKAHAFGHRRGKGRVKKADMIEAAAKKWPMHFPEGEEHSDDLADALWLLDLATAEYARHARTHNLKHKE